MSKAHKRRLVHRHHTKIQQPVTRSKFLHYTSPLAAGILIGSATALYYDGRSETLSKKIALKKLELKAARQDGEVKLTKTAIRDKDPLVNDLVKCARSDNCTDADFAAFVGDSFKYRPKQSAEAFEQADKCKNEIKELNDDLSYAQYNFVLHSFSNFGAVTIALYLFMAINYLSNRFSHPKDPKPSPTVNQ